MLLSVRSFCQDNASCYSLSGVKHLAIPGNFHLFIMKSKKNLPLHRIYCCRNEIVSRRTVGLFYFHETRVCFGFILFINV